MIVNNYEYLFFDADQTLFDFQDASKLAFAHFCKINNIPNLERAYKSYSRHNKEAWHDLEAGKISALQLRERRFSRFIKDMNLSLDPMASNKLYLDLLVEHTELYEDTRETLEQLAHSHNIYVITNGLQEAQRRRLAKTGITDYFQGIIVSDEIGVAKPSKQYFEHAFELANNPSPEEILIVGDSYNSDIKGAHNMNVSSALVSRFGTPSFRGKPPTYFVQDLKSLL